MSIIKCIRFRNFWLLMAEYVFVQGEWGQFLSGINNSNRPTNEQQQIMKCCLTSAGNSVTTTFQFYHQLGIDWLLSIDWLFRPGPIICRLLNVPCCVNSCYWIQRPDSLLIHEQYSFPLFNCHHLLLLLRMICYSGLTNIWIYWVHQMAFAESAQ